MRLLADDEELALEGIDGGGGGAPGDEDLADHRLYRADALAQNRIVDRHVAPAEKALALGGDEMRQRLLARAARPYIARQEHHADAVFARRRQGKAQALRLGAKQLGGELQQDAGTVARQRVGAHGAAMRQIEQDADAVGDDAVALAVLDMGDEADAARIVLVAWVVETLRRSFPRATHTSPLPAAQPWFPPRPYSAHRARSGAPHLRPRT